MRIIAPTSTTGIIDRVRTNRLYNIDETGRFRPSTPTFHAHTAFDGRLQRVRFRNPDNSIRIKGPERPLEFQTSLIHL